MGRNIGCWGVALFRPVGLRGIAGSALLPSTTAGDAPEPEAASPLAEVAEMCSRGVGDGP